MAHRYVQSLVWLLGCSGVGYVLYVACTPTDAQVKKIRNVSLLNQV